MISFFQQVFNLLTTDPGNLTYHLVLAFSIVGTLQVSILRDWGEGISRGRRLLLGLSLLLILRVGLFLGAGLAWQRVDSAEQLLPLVDRVASALSALLIVWLWAVSESRRGLDWIFLMLGMLSVVVSVWGILMWLNTSIGFNLSGSWFDWAAGGTTAAFLLLGCVILLTRRQRGWIMGIFMLLILLTGYLVYYLVFPEMADYSGVIRLSQLIAYPLFLFLPQYFSYSKSSSTVEKGRTSSPDELPVEQPARLSNLSIWGPLFELVNQASPDQIQQTIAVTVCRSIGANVCLLISPPDTSGSLLIQCGYEESTRRIIPAGTIDAQQLPVIVAAFRQGRALRLPANSTSPDIASIARFLDCSRTGHLMAAPVLARDGHIIIGLIVLTDPSSERPWRVEHQYQLIEFTKPLAYFLQHIDQVVWLQNELGQTRQSLRLAQSQIEKTVEENEQLIGQVLLLRQDLEQSGADQESGEFKLALQEIAILRTTLSALEKKIQLAEIQSSKSVEELELLATQVRELHTPLGSITHSLDTLLEETGGEADNPQRQLIERVKISVERMDLAIDDLLHSILVQQSQVNIAAEPINLIDNQQADLDGRGVSVQVELAKGLPRSDVP